MARSSKPITSFLPCIIAVIFITVVIFSSLAALWWFALEQGGEELAIDFYLWRVLSFTLLQAAISTCASVILAIIFAKSLYQCHFLGKVWLLRILSLTFVLPSLVVVTGLLGIYGKMGWLAKLCIYLKVDYTWSIYGINGILLAHIFLNFPFMAKYCYQSLLLIPNEQKQLAQQLGLNPLHSFRYVELPVLMKQVLPLCGLVFMLCFSSFATVLALSGGPKYTTIEVAIYEAVHNFELHQAVLLSCIQLFFCIIFMLLLKRLEPKQSLLLIKNIKPYFVKNAWWQNILGYSIIFISAFFIISPLLAITINGIYYFSLTYLTNSLFYSFFTSIAVAICSALLAMVQAISILWANSRLQLIGKTKVSEILMLLGSLSLAVPSMVLSSGLFILFYSQSDVQAVIFTLIVVANSFLALPFILKQLSPPLVDLTKRYYSLSQSLNIFGLNYLYFIEFKAIKKLFLYCFAFSSIMSMGDFGIVALFGGQNFMTLPYYLYSLISHYHHEEASFVALFLLIISFLFITLFENAYDDRI